MTRIGILAIQGDIEAHAAASERVGGCTVRVLREKDLDGIDALILPGGESTTIAKGLARLGLYEPLRQFAATGRPLLGTCAGAILLSREVENHPVETLGLLDAVAARNAYGTQVDSFAALSDAGSEAPFRDLRCTFIRAPQLRDLGPDVQVLARVEGRPVLVRQRRVLAATFHPELGEGPSPVHRLLLALADEAAGPA